MCGLISAYAQASQLNNLLPPVRLAVVNSFGSNLSVRYFNGTVNAIAKAVAPRRLVVQFYDQEVFLEAAQNKEFDLAIASSGLTALMTDASGAAALLTIINSRTPDPNHANAGVIVVRSDRDDINYRWYFIVGCGALLLIILNWAYLAFAVRRKTEQLRKKVEENREYERENRKITERIEALEKAKSIGIISAMVAHELKQPLGAINNYSEAILRQLKRGKKPAEEILTEALSEIKSESQRASEIVEFVRNIGRKEPRQRKRFNLESAVEHTIELMKRLGRLNSKCTLTGAENLFVYADPLNVDLVLMNLLKNAEEAVRNQQNAEIKVEIKNAGADALVIIEDNGPDMTDDQFASLRNLGQSSKKDGLGLGLAIVRELLEANGGSLKLVRIPSGGLRCIASLPIALEDKDGPG